MIISYRNKEAEKIFNRPIFPQIADGHSEGGHEKIVANRCSNHYLKILGFHQGTTWRH